MQLVDLVLAWVRREPALALAIGLGLYLSLVTLMIGTLVTLSRFRRRQARLLRGLVGATNLEDVLLEHGDRVRAMAAEVAGAQDAVSSNAASLRNCLQRVGVVRYDAFPDVGGGQSFSVAILDADSSGLVLSGIVSRSESRVYAKPVVEGRSPVILTDEEQSAIERSRSGGGPSLSGDAVPSSSPSPPGKASFGMRVRERRIRMDRNRGERVLRP